MEGGSSSHLLDLLMSYFHDFFLQFVLSFLLVIEIASMVFRESMGVTVYISTFALNPQKSYFLPTVEATVFILLGPFLHGVIDFFPS